MNIRTAAWRTKLPANHVRIGISRSIPRNTTAGYRVYGKLVPGPWFNSVGVAEYRERYDAETLSHLDPLAVAAELDQLAGAGRTAVLCCWEAPGSGSWCHRALAATWLAQAIGEPVPEIGFGYLAQHEHPMLPPATMV